MRGSIQPIPSNPTLPDRTALLGRLVTLDELRNAVGGDIEIILDFDTISRMGERQPCMVFCNKRAQSENLHQNDWASIRWRNARNHKDLKDGKHCVISGPVVVLTGDEEFMKALDEVGYAYLAPEAPIDLTSIEDLAV